MIRQGVAEAVANLTTTSLKLTAMAIGGAGILPARMKKCLFVSWKEAIEIVKESKNRFIKKPKYPEKVKSHLKSSFI
jgi:hypothetical protein